MTLLWMNAIAVAWLSTAVTNAFGPTPAGGQCLDQYGTFCSAEKGNVCVSPVGGSAWIPFFPGADTCVKVKGAGLTCRNPTDFCSKLTNRCMTPTAIPCKTDVLCARDGFCDYFSKRCATVTNPGTTCTGFGSQGSCDKGQECNPTLGQCVSLGLPCTTGPNQLFFSYINEADQCGDVDAAPRMPAGIFASNNTIALNQYRLTTENGFVINQTAFLQLGNCKSNGYAYPAGFKMIDWAPQTLMSGICNSQCGCNYPDCPDAHDDPNRCDIFGCTAFYCSLCGPKYNAPINVSLYTRTENTLV